MDTYRGTCSVVGVTPPLHVLVPSPVLSISHDNTYSHVPCRYVCNQTSLANHRYTALEE